jgi:hypothetical protein
MPEAPDDAHTELVNAIEQRDAVQIRQLMEDLEFILLMMSDEGEGGEQDEDAANVISTEIDGMDLLVVFTKDSAVQQFINSMEEMFDEDEEVEGYILSGGNLLEYMPPEHGLYLNPESDDALVVDTELVGLVGQADPH